MKIKRIALGLTSIITCLMLSNVSLYAQNNILSNTKLGKTINTVEAENYGDISKYSVLKDEYYQNINYNENYDKAKSKSECIHASSKSKIQNEFQKNMRIESSVNSLPVKMFTFSAKQKFEFDYTFKETDYVSSEYYEVTGEKDYCEYYIEDLNYKCNEFKNNLSDSYCQALIQLSEQSITYETFFQRFGTHLIGAYTIGDRISIDLIIGTNSCYIDSNLETRIENDLKAELGKTSASISSSSEFIHKYSMSEEETYIKIAAYSNSSILTAVTDVSNIASEYQNWNKNTNINTGTIVGYDSNSLIPLWDFLPDNSPISSDEMREEFIKYANEKELVIPISDNSYTFKDINETYTRDAKHTITDCDRFSNYIDYFRIEENIGWKVIKEKYKSVEIQISFSAEKKRFGDRHVYLYYASDAFEGSDKHNEYIDYHSVSCTLANKWYKKTYKFTIDCSNLKSKDFAIVWKASGNGNDTWYCKNVSVNIVSTLK